jgi:hypothetical protein
MLRYSSCCRVSSIAEESGNRLKECSALVAEDEEAREGVVLIMPYYPRLRVQCLEIN